MLGEGEGFVVMGGEILVAVLASSQNIFIVLRPQFFCRPPTVRSR